jgi:hypothetical protein
MASFLKNPERHVQFVIYAEDGWGEMGTEGLNIEQPGTLQAWYWPA